VTGKIFTVSVEAVGCVGSALFPVLQALKQK